MFSDTVGVLTSWSDGVLIITRRTGESVSIRETSLAAGKVVPPAPARRRGQQAAPTVPELLEIADRGWPAPHRERLGGWTLRAAGGFTRRANSVLPLGDPGCPPAEAQALVAEWYAARGLPPYIQVATGGAAGGQEALDADLAHCGWTAEGHALAMTAPLGGPAGAAGGESVLLTREPDAGWLRRYHRTGALADAAGQVLSGGPSVWFAQVPGGQGSPAAIGRCVVDGRWAGLSAVEVDPAHRRSGLATAVVAALARRAAAEGASQAHLSVEAGNHPALALWKRFGFTVHHRYHYRRAPLAAAPGTRRPAGCSGPAAG